uniref:NADH:ubiquinone oxidoreductase intermediate-associated protein 30 domain-containing protein n=1 Tax=Chlamydomonas leiostraca TaxID=1034604 RepID=A0A7S0R692_9CHLO|mmetsp:Transcript_14800/g.36948  ORF Transcript_14800/g.36948 Transcript_14800/m.36948 type:complete len:294 (+) Transcript_14800:1527-2408(+)
MARLLREALRRVDKFLKVDVNPDPIVLSDFSKGSALKRWRVFSDATFGGNSKGTLTAGEEGGKHAVFEGRYSKLINDGSPLVRAGYVGINTVLPRPLNLSLHDYLEWRVRARDGHTYVASVRTDQYTGGDEEAWQAPLSVSRSGEWEDVRVNLDDLVFTFRGRLVQQQQAFARMPRHAIIAVGLTLAASKDMPDEGDFRLEVARVTAGAKPVSGLEEERKAFQGYMHVEDHTSYADSQHHAQPSGRSSKRGGEAGAVLPDEPVLGLGSKRARSAESVQAGSAGRSSSSEGLKQ